MATNTWAAIQGRDALEIEWDDGPHGYLQHRRLREGAASRVTKPGASVRNQGDPEAALASAAKVFTREYYAHHMLRTQRWSRRWRWPLR